MPSTQQLRTDRLVLRRWRDGDRAPFAAMNADPEVMEYFPAALTSDESDAFIDRIEAGFERHGFGLWAVEIAETGRFIGFTGLSVPRFEAHFTPAVEIGWRLVRPGWGHGYASEAARRALGFAFDDLGLGEVVSFTTRANLRSQAVMERIGMTHDPADDFDHPLLEEGHPFRPHVLWRMTAGHRPDRQVGGRARSGSIVTGGLPPRLGGRPPA
ncbi:GNAT family N-acetyltransferase [Actinomadura scrupuli]|uniref:GNAT family N-acetyltransferase n=1 Tax=Actinomadura scrupuli TaxID=559629 RepID=UPI003D98BEF6